MSAVLESGLARQERVRSFLERSLATGQVSHAYLFGGPASADLEGAARALAQALVCPEGGCGICAECQRVAHGTHPDVLVLSPESAQQGYLVEQVRDLIVQSSLSPVRGERKVYILRSAERLGTQAANALLKTLEEPTPDVVFILLAPTAEAVLTTVRSRCTVVPFSATDPELIVADLVEGCGASESLARSVLAVTGSYDEARAFIVDGRRVELRERTLRLIDSIDRRTDLELLAFADEVVATVRDEGDAPEGESDGEAELEEEFLSATARKDAEARRRREATARAKVAIAEVVRVVDVVLADALSLALGSDRTLIDPDHAPIASDVAERGLPVVLEALGATAEASRALTRPTTPSLVLSVLFLRLKEALCPSSAQ